MRKEKWYIRLLRFLGIIKTKKTDYEKDNRLKFEMCMKARNTGVCQNACEICAWFFDDSEDMWNGK